MSLYSKQSRTIICIPDSIFGINSQSAEKSCYKSLEKEEKNPELMFQEN